IQSTGMSSFAAGILTTLPVVCMGLFAPFAPRLAQRYGTERVLLLVMAALTLGLVIRGLDHIAWLFMGAGLAGAAIAMGNVLLPGLVKRDFPKHAAIMTGLYTIAHSAGAATAAGLTIPIEDLVVRPWSLALS